MYIGSQIIDDWVYAYLSEYYKTTITYYAMEKMVSVRANVY
jgi:hypothetical protein